MKKFKIINLITWEVTKITASSQKEAIQKFKQEKGLSTFDTDTYKVKHPVDKQTYSSLSLGEYETRRTR